MLTEPFFYVFLGIPVFFIVSGIFFFIQKNKIIEKYRQPDAVMFKNIIGTMDTVSKSLLQYNQNFQGYSFDILLNQNSMFLFPRNFYMIPRGCINLRFKSDAKNTKNPTVLREFHIKANSVELIYYPDYMINTKRTISLNGLNEEQILLFQKALNRQT